MYAPVISLEGSVQAPPHIHGALILWGYTLEEAKERYWQYARLYAESEVKKLVKEHLIGFKYINLFDVNVEDLYD